MPRKSSALSTFIAREAQRNSAGTSKFKRSNTVKLDYAFQSSGVGSSTAYALPEDTVKKLLALSDKNCCRCKSTGIKGWRNQGMSAVICDCVKRELANKEKVMEDAQAKLKAMVLNMARQEVEEKKKNGEVAPARECVCKATPCPDCGDKKYIALTDDEWAAYISMKRMTEAQEKMEAMLKEQANEPASVPEAPAQGSSEVPAAGK